MVVVSWIIIFFFGKLSIKKYLPASVLILLVEKLHAAHGKKNKWWIFYNKPKSYLYGEFPYQIGPFLMLALWTLKKTYGDFKPFILLNAAISAFFSFPLTYMAKQIKYYRLHRVNHIQMFFYFFYKAFLLYGFQYVIERGFSKEE
ncbi:hypothetical protein F7732_15490 [Bacillus mesophilum]|uniref:Uncharacterized protein n=2 Tax=Bacillus mesophilum TaxID=1071718 RepID=A0A7V7RK49_9BACI|nr:hypothetical protein F7732_15490 [Bacillus mesophilum]